MKRNIKLFVTVLVITSCLYLLFLLLHKEKSTSPVSRKRNLSTSMIPLPRNNLRQYTINKSCWKQKKKRTMNPIFTPPIDANIYVEPVRKIFYCPVQKAGSSFWLRTLTATSSDTFKSPYDMLLQHHTLMYFPTWKGTVSNADMTQTLKNAFSFLFVREPYGRIYSAYVDKVYYPNKVFWPKFTKGIAKAIGRRGSNGFDVTFAETVRYIIQQSAENPDDINVHFKPIHKLCDPCNVYYKFIGKLETFQDDVEFLLDQWRNMYSDNDVKFNDFEKESALDDITRHVNMLFYMIGSLNLPPEMTTYDLLQRGWSDLHIRGYLSKHIPLPFMQSQAKTVTKEMFMRAIKDALTIPVDHASVALQREEAMVQAYRTVPIEDLKKLRGYIRLDCQLFDYECSPENLFNKDIKPFPDTKHLYLKG